MWWLHQVALSVSLGSLALVAYYVSNTVLRCRRALREFREKSCGLPILEEGHDALTNHGITLHLDREACARITRWHERYGKTFGLLYGERPCASTTDLDLLKLIAHDEQRLHLNRMPFKSALQSFEHDNIFLAENEQWRRLRRAFGPALKKYKTPNMMGEIEAAVGALVEGLERQLAGGQEVAVDADKLAHKFSLDVVFRCLYKQPGLIDYEKPTSYWAEVVDDALRSPISMSLPMRLALAFPALGQPIDWLAKKFTDMGAWHRDVSKFIDTQTRVALEARRELMRLNGATGKEGSFVVENLQLADGTEYRRFVVDYVIDAFLDGKLNKSEYLNSSFFLFNAADKTVADALSHTLYFLAANAPCQERLRQSLAREGLESAYLSWVINESLRLHPPAAIGCSRTVARDIELPGGRGRLPAGTYVISPLNTIHRLPEYWGADAHEFKPERWQDTSHHHPMQFLPFGAGLRSCPGRELALFEMKKLLLETLSRFTLTCTPKADIDNFDSPYMLYTLPHSPTLIRVTKNPEDS